MSRYSAHSGRVYPPELREWVCQKRLKDGWLLEDIARTALDLWPLDPISARSIAKIVGQAVRTSPKAAQRVTHFRPRTSLNQSCLKITYRDRQAVQCGAPTEGKTYCTTCARHLLTLTDRPPIAEPTDRKPYRWEREIWKRKSA